ncbi:hypothetical protein [Streptomyces sp. MK37H]|uniref:hypothetical protein n=1 Tax=Streptomyces sp. MK37H TaxID=2699117 RepID=UPI001B396F03|nr:hypothetical protein [Streptomyces sp. MK37H]MBP8538247.1 hypothetical protein [Streptomyces sp. MK37H]
MLDDVAGQVAAAILQAAGSDAWAAMRDRIARLLGRGDAGRERAELERLDRTTSDLEDPELSEEERTLFRQTWQARFRRFLEGLDEGERERVVAELRALVEPYGEPARRDGGLVRNNTFSGPTAVQTGTDNQQTNYFGSGA